LLKLKPEEPRLVSRLPAGARLRVQDAQFVKPQFHLKLDRASPGRACKVAWKKGDLIGIKFV
jgi:hypothetical protein